MPDIVYIPLEENVYNPTTTSVLVIKQPTNIAGPTILQNNDGTGNPGLEYLATIDQLIIEQRMDLLKVFFTHCEPNNHYTITNSIGQNIFRAVEDNDCCTRSCCGPYRPFDMKVMDLYHNTVMNLRRPYACSSCFIPCWMQSIEVSSPSGRLFGTVQQEWAIFCPTFAIKNAIGETVMRLEGPFIRFSMCRDVDFKIMSNNGVQLGKISKKWSSFMQECCTDADNFGLFFPKNIDKEMKAVLLGASILIDMMFFERGVRYCLC